jgi:hypothetical protein
MCEMIVQNTCYSAYLKNTAGAKNENWAKIFVFAKVFAKNFWFLRSITTKLEQIAPREILLLEEIQG